MTGISIGARLGAAMFALASFTANAASEPIVHWKLAGDAKDSSGNKHDAISHGVKFTAKGPDGKSLAAEFDGRTSRLELKAVPAIQLGADDFTIALWVHTSESLDDDLGDLVTMYDDQKRVGFNLSLRNNTGVTSCQPNSRQLQFGIDAGSEPKWTDEGRPGDATLAFALAVHDDNLYAGTASNAKNAVGRAYRYGGPGKWIDCGAPDKCNAVSAMAVFKDKLYAASSKYRFAGSALAESENTNRGGGVFRYDGDQRWIEVGRLPETEAIGGLVVYKDRLYVSSLYKPAGFFRYESDGKWTSLAVPGGKRVESLGVFNGYLWATSYDGGRVYRYDGNDWKDFGNLGDNTQTYSFAIHRSRLCVGTWPSGRVYRLNEDRWDDLGRLGNELEVMGMLVHNGQLYAGTLPLAQVYRFDGVGRWTKTGQLDQTPDVRYRRAWTMAQYRGRLMCSTLPSGHVYSLDAGPCVTYDRPIPAGWRHVAAVKHGSLLKLYVDGKLVAESSKFDPKAFDLTTAEPLRVGAGPGDFFRGALYDVRIYRQAIKSEEIARLAKP
jgi:hypothetical protein